MLAYLFETCLSYLWMLSVWYWLYKVSSVVLCCLAGMLILGYGEMMEYGFYVV